MREGDDIHICFYLIYLFYFIYHICFLFYWVLSSFAVIIAVTKLRKMTWAGEVACMANTKVSIINPGGKETEKNKWINGRKKLINFIMSCATVRFSRRILLHVELMCSEVQSGVHFLLLQWPKPNINNSAIYA
jgi:hypothetical protein